MIYNTIDCCTLFAGNKQQLNNHKQLISSDKCTIKSQLCNKNCQFKYHQYLSSDKCMLVDATGVIICSKMLKC